MGIVVDIFLVAILALNIIFGYKKGLVNVIFNICAFLIAIVITFILYKPVSNMIIENTDIKDRIEAMIINNNKDVAEPKEENASKNDMQSYIDSAVTNVAEETKSQALETVAGAISLKAIQIIICVVIFIITRIILVVLQFFTKAIASLPLIKQLNEIGGIAYGIIKGLLIIYIILTIIYFVISFNGNGELAKIIEESYVTKFFYNNNIIVNYCLLGKNLL